MMYTFQRSALVLATLGALACTTLACGDDPTAAPNNPAPAPDASSDGAVDASESDSGFKAGILGGQNDRVGRPGVSVLLVDPSSRDTWNRMETFTLGNVDVSAATLRSMFQRNLVRWDLLDGADDWKGGPEDGSGTVEVGDGDGGTSTAPQVHPLVSAFSNDALVVDTGKPFAPAGYLDVESATLVSKAPGTHLTCGGRWMNEDAVDKMLSFIVKKSSSGISDGVATPSRPATTTFPYLVAP